MQCWCFALVESLRCLFGFPRQVSMRTPRSLLVSATTLDGRGQSFFCRSRLGVDNLKDLLPLGIRTQHSSMVIRQIILTLRVGGLLVVRLGLGMWPWLHAYKRLGTAIPFNLSVDKIETRHCAGLYNTIQYNSHKNKFFIL